MNFTPSGIQRSTCVAVLPLLVVVGCAANHAQDRAGRPATSAQPVAFVASSQMNGEPGDGAPVVTAGHSLGLAFVRTHCAACHAGEKRRGGFSVEALLAAGPATAQAEIWQKVLDVVSAAEMPPEDEPQPEPAAREALMAWVDETVFAQMCDGSDPGQVLPRRLNRTEYQNTIEDLLGIDVPVAQRLPPDPSAQGFDNNAASLTMSPLLLEQYLAVADEALNAAASSGTSGMPALFSARPRSRTDQDVARAIVASFTRRAFRRPVDDETIAALMGVIEGAWSQGASFSAGVREGLRAVLVSPRFLYRAAWVTDAADDESATLDPYALAERLSYFLWSTMPDEALLREAAAGSLAQNLEAQVTRMLASPRAGALVQDFGGQWLQFRKMNDVTPAWFVYKTFKPEMRAVFRRETELLFEHIVREDRNVMEFLTADYTFVNDALARHYGIAGVDGPAFRQVSLKGLPRRGVLTHASILTLTSRSTRTSPAMRGKWVLDNVLGTPPPPPPPVVPELPGDKHMQLKAITKTLRQRLEEHRADPVCASCHARFDPIGFGLENFDGIGAFRTHERDQPIDASGAFNSGERFEGALDMIDILASAKADAFVTTFATRLLVYALGRELRPADRCVVRDIVAQARSRDLRFSAFVQAVVSSAPFQKTRRPPSGLASGPEREVNAP